MGCVYSNTRGQYKSNIAYNLKYITWISDDKVSWTFKGPGMGPDPSVQISARPYHKIQELHGCRTNRPYTSNVPSAHENYLHSHISPPDAIDVGCNPKNFPTEQYINQYVHGVICSYYERLDYSAYSRHIEAYTHPNLTTWVDDYHQTWPKNKFLGQC